MILLHGHFGDAWLGELHSQNYLLVGDMIPSPQALYVLLRVSSIVGTASLTPFGRFRGFND